MSEMFSDWLEVNERMNARAVVTTMFGCKQFTGKVPGCNNGAMGGHFNSLAAPLSLKACHSCLLNISLF